MKLLIRSLVITCTAAAVAALGVAGPAEAGTTSCGFKPLHDNAPLAEVRTCGEADGNRRRALTTVFNHSPRPLDLTSVRSLISSPEYAERECVNTDVHSPVPLRLAPGQSITCVTPWVTVRFPFQSGASAFSLITGSQDGRFFSHTSSFVATFD